MTQPLLLFDMDGTLIIERKKPPYTRTNARHYRNISITEQMKDIAIKHGVPAKHVMHLNRMSHIWNATRRYLENNCSSEEYIQQVIYEINVPFMEEERADHAISVLLPYTIQGLTALKEKGYKMGLVTTASRESYDRISTQNKYGYFGKYFTHSVTRNECKYIKPEPEPIHRILEHYKQSNFVYIGDSDHDAQACLAAGGTFILINTRGYNPEIIRTMNSSAIINTLIELPEALNLLKQVGEHKPDGDLSLLPKS